MKVNLDMKPNEYRFLCINKNTSMEKITRVYAKDYNAAFTQATGRLKQSEWIYQSCVFPDHEVWSLNPDGTLRT